MSIETWVNKVVIKKKKKNALVIYRQIFLYLYNTVHSAMKDHSNDLVQHSSIYIASAWEMRLYKTGELGPCFR